MSNQPQHVTLKKEMRKMDIWALALGAIIGWGCFIMPGTIFLPKAGPSAIIGLLIGGCVMSVIAFSYGYCIQKHPLTGGEFIYTDAAFGKKHAFACAWMIVLGHWSLIPLNASAIGIVSRYLIPGVFQFGKLYAVAGWDVYLGEILLSSAFIVILGYMNIKGAKSTGWFQATVAVTLSASVLFCLIGIIMAKPDLSNLQPFYAQIVQGEVREQDALSCIIAIACYAPYCFVGFDCIPQAAEEYNFSHKVALGLMIGAIMAGAAIYAIMVFCTAVITPWDSMILGDATWATGAAVAATLGEVGLLFLGIAMLCAVLSGMNAFYLSASRLLYSMSCADALPSAFGKLHPKYGTPTQATYFLLLISLICPWFGPPALNWIVDITCVGAAVGFTYTCAAATSMAKKEEQTKQIVISSWGAVLSAILIIFSIVPDSPGAMSSQSLVILFVWIALGILFWFRIKNTFLHGKWAGINVEKILQSKMSQNNTTAESYQIK
jgi:amino acid transporter